MKILIATFLFGIFLLPREIPQCFLALKKASGLKAAQPERLPEAFRNTRKVETENGEVDVTCVDGYRIFYNNDKGAPFVNLKVEMSADNAYESDKKKILDNLKYANANSPGTETKDLLELSYNGYKIYGLSRKNIDEPANILGIFVMFPGDGTTVYFYFNNLKPEHRTFRTTEEYKSQRNDFLGQYTAHIKECLK